MVFGSRGPSKIRLLQSYKVTWIHTIDAICSTLENGVSRTISMSTRKPRLMHLAKSYLTIFLFFCWYPTFGKSSWWIIFPCTKKAILFSCNPCNVLIACCISYFQWQQSYHNCLITRYRYVWCTDSTSYFLSKGIYSQNLLFWG